MQFINDSKIDFYQTMEAGMTSKTLVRLKFDQFKYLLCVGFMECLNFLERAGFSNIIPRKFINFLIIYEYLVFQNISELLRFVCLSLW